MSTGRLIAGMAVLVLVGAPMVWFLWDVLNELLLGEVNGGRLLVALPVLAVFIGYLYFVSRRIQAWESRDLG